MGRIIGIDLGTTNSCVAYVERGEPIIIPNADGGRVTPSVVAFTEEGERLVGNLAKRQAVMNPRRTVFAVKRLMGRKYDSPEIKKCIEFYPYKIVPAKNGDAWIEIDGELYSPPQISAMILMELKKYASEFLGEEVKDAVITVPAYFDDYQRQATRDAGRIAGLNVLRIINEPTAASLAYGYHKAQEGKIVVFDLGGGTLDVTVLELKEGVFHVLATHGNTFLGGDDFDRVLMEHMIKEFKKQTGIDLSQDKMALQRIREAAEKAKMELSSLKETEISLPFIYADEKGPRHLHMTITRAEFEELTKHLIDALEEPALLALEEAKIKKEEIDKVILVGGMTRVPAVQRKVEEIFGKPPSKEVNPDEVVAAGAAIQGAIMSGEMKSVLLLDVTPLSLGVETEGGLFTKIIEKNTTIPCKRSRIFSTVEDNQEFVTIHVLQGEREIASENRSLGKFQLVGIPPAPRGVPQIEVTFYLDANSILYVTAKDLGTGKEQQMVIEPSSGLSKEEIERMIKEAEKWEEEDRKRKELIELRNRARGLLFSLKRTYEEFGSSLDEETRKSLLSLMEALDKAVESKDYEFLKENFKNLESQAYAISQKIYKGAKEVE
jgi:molecular chaperone DnaK